ncbi:hypothetical protein LCGC14_2715180 [marine sediment metagenome]|uniref:Uncharacterized protein n=1 Tax=marine sediment metagenome TaxID=412755 RepID=A0A0F8ZBM5_9ZZZZ
MNKEKRKEILNRGLPNIKWEGEPMLGAWYTEEEIEKLAKGWIEHGDSYEVQLGVVFINYLEG